jgi:nitrogen fixation/metabolism regulation signal transduction histidine kinase
MTSPSTAPLPVPSAAPPAGGPQAPVRYKRSVKNYVIDPRFQFKYTSILVGFTVVVAIVLVSFLAKTSSDVVAQSEAATRQGQLAIAESRKVSDVVRMSVKDDPDYAANPELLESVNAATRERDKQFEAQEKTLKDQQATIAAQQRQMLLSLSLGLALMVIFVAAVGIYVTHKVAGPIYKMKMLLRGVEQGKLNFQGKLRKGDELQDFFEAFSRMVDALRQRQAREVEELEQAMALARESGASDQSIAKIELVHREMKAALDK